jgi:hypothetical protein
MAAPGECKEGDSPSEQVVLNALGDEQYDFRTVGGIADETGLNPAFIEATLKKHADKVRISPVPDPKGNTLYTLSSRPRKAQEIISETRAFLAGSAR